MKLKSLTKKAGQSTIANTTPVSFPETTVVESSGSSWSGSSDSSFDDCASDFANITPMTAPTATSKVFEVTDEMKASWVESQKRHQELGNLRGIQRSEGKVPFLTT